MTGSLMSKTWNLWHTMAYKMRSKNYISVAIAHANWIKVLDTCEAAGKNRDFNSERNANINVRERSAARCGIHNRYI